MALGTIFCSPGARLSEAVPLPPARRSRVVVAEGRRLAPPVGQGQLRGVEGVVEPGRGQNHRDDEGEEGTVRAPDVVDTGEPGADGAVLLSAQTAVHAEVERIQRCQAGERRRKGPSQLVLVDLQHLQAGEAAQCSRQGPGQLVLGEHQPLKVREAAQLGGDGARQLVGGEIQL